MILLFDTPWDEEKVRTIIILNKEQITEQLKKQYYHIDMDGDAFKEIITAAHLIAKKHNVTIQEAERFVYTTLGKTLPIFYDYRIKENL